MTRTYLLLPLDCNVFSFIHHQHPSTHPILFPPPKSLILRSAQPSTRPSSSLRNNRNASSADSASSRDCFAARLASLLARLASDTATSSDAVIPPRPLSPESTAFGSNSAPGSRAVKSAFDDLACDCVKPSNSLPATVAASTGEEDLTGATTALTVLAATSSARARSNSCVSLARSSRRVTACVQIL